MAHVLRMMFHYDLEAVSLIYHYALHVSDQWDERPVDYRAECAELAERIQAGR